MITFMLRNAVINKQQTMNYNIEMVKYDLRRDLKTLSDSTENSTTSNKSVKKKAHPISID